MNMNADSKTTRRWVWVPCPKNLYKQAYIVEEAGSKTTVQSETLETFGSQEVFKMNPSKFDRVEDLAELSHLNEPSVLHNLKTRYDDSYIYTYSGLFLLALNPYRNLNIYNDEVKRKMMRLKARTGEPHIFAVANEAYRDMISNKANQSILITGESGAGKTENTKRVIEFLAFAAGRTKEGILNETFSVEDALMSANPILEAFGNAKTVKNDNSSRFGKFIQIKFKGGSICGAKIEKYLLEKSRVTYQNANERNFHIFYYLLAGASKEMKKQLFITSNPSDYKCLKSSKYTIDGVDDSAEFEKLTTAFKQFGISSPLKYYKIIAAILNLSNLEFTEQDDKASIANTQILENVCLLLNVTFIDLMNAIVHPVMKAGSEYITYYRTTEQAIAVVEGFMKLLYESMFDELVSEINNRLDTSYDTYIGILDIAGFEIFQNNSFEQLCINYTNEKLQQFFNHHMFILEQEIYRNENIEWDFIDFGLDLEPTIKSIESSNPIGILAYIDEECVMPKATDKTLLEKIVKVDQIEEVKFKNNFKIKHYAGFVEYEVKNWLAKNKDVESERIMELLARNKGPDFENNTGKVRFSDQNKGFVKKGSFKTVAQCHKDNLRNLMSALRDTQPHFVRCILPNLEKLPDSFNKKLILDQLRCNGVLEGIRISRLGYPSRLPFAEFNSRYEIFLDESTLTDDEKAIPREQTRRIVKELNISKNDCRVGKSMVFFRQGILADIEDLRDKKINKIAQVIQGILRMKIEKRKNDFENLRLEAITNIQANSRYAIDLLRWKWWSLYLKIGPLLEVRKSESDLKMKENQIQSQNAIIEKITNENKNKDNEINRLSILVTNLEEKIKGKNSEITDKEELLTALRNDNSKSKTEINSLINDNKSNQEIIASLKDKINQSEIRELNNKKEVERLNNEIKAARESLFAREKEIEMIAKEDLKNVLKSKENELNGLKENISQMNNLLNESKNEIKELKFMVEKKDSELNALNERVAMHEKDNSHLINEIKNLQEIVVKLRDEIKDAQLENENLNNKNVSIESVNTQLTLKIKDLNKEIDYQKAKCAGLESSNAMLKNITTLKSIEPVAAPVVSDGNQEKLIKSLTSKLENEKKLNQKLIEEKDLLYDENLKLMQNKLDELFQTEQQFNAAKSAMALELRAIESENARLKKEPKAVQSQSDQSDDSAFERLAAMLESEKAARKNLDVKLVKLESANIQLQNTINELQAKKDTKTVDISQKSLDLINEDLSQLKAYLNMMADTFQRKYYAIMNEKDNIYKSTLSKMEQENKDALEKMANFYKREQDSFKSKYDELVKELNKLSNELDGAKVKDKLQVTEIKELKSHISKLEDAYNKREGVIEEVKQKYNALVGEMKNKNEQLQETIDSIKEYSISIKDKYNSSVVAELKEKLDLANKENQSLLQEITNLKSENLVLEKQNDEISELIKIIDIKPNVNAEKVESIVQEKIVSSFVADKESLKAMEWKNIISNKVPVVQKEESNGLQEEIVKLSNEINVLNLKLKQAERMYEEEKNMVDALKSCVSIARKSRKH